jgi:hypothetical protein
MRGDAKIVTANQDQFLGIRQMTAEFVTMGDSHCDRPITSSPLG